MLLAGCVMGTMRLVLLLLAVFINPISSTASLLTPNNYTAGPALVEITASSGGG